MFSGQPNNYFDQLVSIEFIMIFLLLVRTYIYSYLVAKHLSDTKAAVIAKCTYVHLAIAN